VKEAGRAFALAVILVHGIVNVLHGGAHAKLAIGLTSSQALFVIVIICALPLIAGALLFTRLRRAAGLLLASSMAGSLLFGVYYHFVFESGDHISHVAPGGWGAVFRGTAFLLAITEALGVWAGIRQWRVRGDAT
jgi:hypothetical protein